MRCILFILLTSLLSSSKAQSIDTSGGYIIINELPSNLELFAIDLRKIYFQNAKLKVKENLGSYHVSFKKAKSVSGYKITKRDKQSLVLKDGDVEILMRINKVANKKIKLVISSNKSIGHWHIPFKRISKEIIYGGGIQFSGYKEPNKSIINLTQENGIGRGGGSISKWTSMAGVSGESYASYCPLPKFTTNMNRSFTWNDYAYSEVEFNNDLINFDVFDTSVSFELGYGASSTEINNMNKPLPYQLPNWSLGTVIGAQGGSKCVLQKLYALTDAGVKVNALWIQDWVGKQPTKFGSRLNWTWKLDKDHYTDFTEFKLKLKEKDIKLLGYINPFFAKNGPYVKEGISNGYFVSNKGIAQEFEFGGIKGYMIDLFKNEAFQWMKNIIQTNLVNQGFSGWMADFAEWYPIGDDSDIMIQMLKMHNEYPVLWSKLNYEIITENSEKELFFFNRSGGMKTEQYSSMMWAGDQMVDYSAEDGLGSVFDAYLSASYSGLPMIHSDVGGYTSVKKPLIKNYLRTELLLKDWMLLEAFTPVFRTHEGLLPEDNIQVYSDSATINSFKRFSDINHTLLPYFQKLIQERNEKGIPIIRQINHAVKDFETTNPGFCVGNNIIIIQQIEMDNYMSLKKLGWKFVNNSGSLINQPNKNDKVVVAIKELDELIK